MSEAPKESLEEKYPSLFDHDKFIYPVAVGPGWIPLVDTLCRLLEKSAEQEGSEVKALQVKEKFGKLRFYAATRSSYHGGLINMAEAYAARICDVCGGLGSMVCINGYYATRCKLHETKPDEQRM